MVKKGRTPFFVISIYGYAKTSSSWNDLTQFFFSFFLILLCAQLRTSFFLQCFTCFSVFRRVDKIIARNNDTTIWKNRRSSFAYPWAIVKTIRVHYETYIYRRNRKIPNCVQWKCKKIFSGILSPICTHEWKCKFSITLRNTYDYRKGAR